MYHQTERREIYKRSLILMEFNAFPCFYFALLTVPTLFYLSSKRRLYIECVECYIYVTYENNNLEQWFPNFLT